MQTVGATRGHLQAPSPQGKAVASSLYAPHPGQVLGRCWRRTAETTTSGHVCATLDGPAIFFFVLPALLSSPSRRHREALQLLRRRRGADPTPRRAPRRGRQPRRAAARG